MKTSVSIDTKQLKASLKRNTIGRLVITVILIGTLYYAISISSITVLVGFKILAVALVISQLTMYLLGISLLIDQAVFEVRKRGQNAS